MARTRDHRCGECSWQGTGSTECRNYVYVPPKPETYPPFFNSVLERDIWYENFWAKARASQVIPYVEDHGV